MIFIFLYFFLIYIYSTVLKGVRGSPPCQVRALCTSVYPDAYVHQGSTLNIVCVCVGSTHRFFVWIGEFHRSRTLPKTVAK